MKACLEFAGPDRAPRDLWALPYVGRFQREELEAMQREFPMDIAGAQLRPGPDDSGVDPLAQPGEYTDEWGSVWRLAEAGVVGEVKMPALAEWSSLKGFEPPWHLIRNRDLPYLNDRCEEGTQFVLSGAARPFERMQFLRGTESLFMDIAYDSPELHRLMGIVHEFCLEDVKWWCASQVDAVVLMDDWGATKSLLISPETWRRLFKPLYQAYCELIHAAGKHVFFHTDGFTRPIIGDLIDVGVDAINCQLFTMDIEELGREFKGKVTFWGEIDRQWVLPFGTPADVREAVARVRRAFDDGQGGVIAQSEWGKYNPTENIRAVYEAWGEETGGRPR